MTNGSRSKPPQPGASAPWYQQQPTGAPASPFSQPGQQQQPMPQGQVQGQPQPGQQQPPSQVPLQPTLRPSQPEAGGQPAFGFDGDQPRDEKYNTLYLASNLQRERRRTQFIVIAVILFAVVGAIFWVALMPDSKPVGANKQGETAAATAGAAPTGTEAPAAPAEPGETKTADDSE